jgi:FkbM family methyltransferase
MLDIGANMGVYSLTASNIIGDAGKIIAFEPDDDNFKVLKKNILKNEFKNIDPVPYAVSDKEETIFFETHSLNSGNHQIRKENYSEAIECSANHLVFVVLANEYVQFEQKLIVFTGGIIHKSQTLDATRFKNKGTPAQYCAWRRVSGKLTNAYLNSE